MKIRWGFASIAIAVFIALALCLYCKFIGDKFRQRSEGTDEYSLNRSVDEDVAADGDLGDEIEDDVEDVDKDLIDRYLAEATALSKEFNPIRKRISKETIDFMHDHAGMYGLGGMVEYENDAGKMDKEYWRPLFEKSKEAMKRVAGSDDLLEMWENNIIQKLLGISQRKPDDHADANGPLDLAALYILALLNEKRDEILVDTVFENSMTGVEARTKIKESIQSDGWPYAELPPIWEYFVPFFGASKTVNDSYIKNNAYSIFPPNGKLLFDFDRAWLVMAIYSYKNKRSQKILYELFKNDSSLATRALQYITLNSVDDELKAEIKNDLKQTIAKFQEDYPEISGKVFDSEGELLDQSTMGLEKLLEDDPAVYRNPAGRDLARIQRYLLLDGAIDFNEKIPSYEKKRWEIVRREIILTGYLISRGSHKSYFPTVFLKADEANFPIYLCASIYRPLRYARFYIETQGERRYTRIDESFFYDHRKYYEEELESPDSIFNERQKAYARELIQYSERAERSRARRNRS